MTTSSEDTSARAESTPGPRWRVFVSSTSRGLDGFRNAARDVIREFRYAGMQCFEPVMMEDFGARDGQAREVCADAVRGCDVLAGIIGVRYGSYPPDDRDCTSYTELEFETAVERRLSCLMYLLEPAMAGRLEYDESQTEDMVDRQKEFRKQVGNALVCEMDVPSEEEFRRKLDKALRKWIEEDSFKRALVDHSEEFTQARERLFDPAAQTSGSALIFGEPGTGKTKLVEVLLHDPLIRSSYAQLVGPLTVRLTGSAGGKDAVEQVQADVRSALRGLAGQPVRVPGAAPVLVALFLETGAADTVVDPPTLRALCDLLSRDQARAVVLAETNNHSVKDHLVREMPWPAEAVVTVRDYGTVSDALEQMRRDAPSVPRWPPAAATLAEALGLRPTSLRDAATYIGTAAGGSSPLAAALIQELLDAIAHEDSPEGRYGALIRNHLDHLSQDARDLVTLMTVLHPKPTLFPDEMALALDLSLDPADAIRLATPEDDEEDEEDAVDADDDEEDEEDEEDEDEADHEKHEDAARDAEEARHRARADRLVAELVGRGLLERQPRLRPARRRPGSRRLDPAEEGTPQELLTLHLTKRRVIQDHLPLTPDQRAEGHTRAEAFFRARVGQTVSGSFDSRFRMEDDSWYDDVEEWIYHLGHTAPGQASVSYATLFLDVFWWWDLYIPSDSDFCGRLLAYGDRPLVHAVPGMPEVVTTLAQFRHTYPPEYQATRARVLAEIAPGDPGRDQARRAFTRQGARTVRVLRELCGQLGITELDALFTDAPSAPGENAADPAAPGSSPASPDDNSRDHLLGLLCVFLGDGHRDRAARTPGGTALATAERCYRRAERYFLAEKDSWDVAWTHYLLGEVISRRGGDPLPLWAQATAEADAETDAELAANIERARADHLRSRGDLEEALTLYGRAVFYAMAFQITSNVTVGADRYTQAFYREIRLHATKMLVEPLLPDLGSPPEARLAEARRRLETMLSSWGGAWTPDPGKLNHAFRSGSAQELEATVDAIADAAFPPGPGDAHLGSPRTDFHRAVRERIERTRTQPWVKALGRLRHWDNARGREIL